MAKNTIIWSETALSQRIEIFEYWNLRNGNTKYSTKLLYKIKGRIKVISENPFAFKYLDYLEYRKCVMTNYSIIYKINENIIKISAFWDNRQVPDKLLEILQNIKTT